MRHLYEDAGAVAGVDLATARAAVIEVQENLQSLLNDRMGFGALDVGDEPDAARVVLESGIVKALLAGRADSGRLGAAILRIASAHQLGSR